MFLGQSSIRATQRPGHGGFRYRKRTRLWGTVGDFPWAPLCKQNCAGCENGRHTLWAQEAGERDAGCFKTRELYVMPPLLCEDIYLCALTATRLRERE